MSVGPKAATLFKVVAEWEYDNQGNHRKLSFAKNEVLDVVSLVALKQENNYWRIKSETIQSYEHQSPRMCSPSRYACLGGTCQVAARR